jgi:hypothetical protein
MASPSNFEIFPPHETFYIQSLLFCTESALASATRIGKVLEKHQDGPYEFPPQPALRQLQNIVLQGAAISRFLWPTDGRFKARGKFLREKLSVNDQSPLRSRKLRNMMEHFDEYLDTHLAGSIAGMFIPDYFGLKPVPDGTPLRIFRAFYTDTAEFEILGETFALTPMVEEIGRLHNLLIDFDEKGSRFPHAN